MNLRGRSVRRDSRRSGTIPRQAIADQAKPRGDEMLSRPTESSVERIDPAADSAQIPAAGKSDQVVAVDIQPFCLGSTHVARLVASSFGKSLDDRLAFDAVILHVFVAVGGFFMPNSIWGLNTISHESNSL